MYPWNMMFACTSGITLVFMLQTKGSCNSLFGCVFKNENRLRILAKSGCVLVYRYTKERNINELRHNSMYGYENNRNSPVYRYTRTAPKMVIVRNNMFFFCHCGSCGRCTVIKPRVQENRQHTQPPSLWSFGEKWPQAFCIFLRKRRRWGVLRVWSHGQEL